VTPGLRAVAPNERTVLYQRFGGIAADLMLIENFR